MASEVIPREGVESGTYPAETEWIRLPRVIPREGVESSLVRPLVKRAHVTGDPERGS